MSRWFRHYAGMVRDDKLVRAAIHAKQPVERVVWVFGAILESAAEVNDGGTYEFDAGEAAHFLHCEETDINSITEALTSLSRLGDGRVTRWPGRQFQSDMSALRQKKYRSRKNAEKSNGNNMDSAPSHTVTWPSRDGVVTDQRQSTESETEKKERKKDNPPALAQNSVPREEASKIPPAAAGLLEFSKEGSPEDQFWAALPALANKGIRRSLCVKLAKLNDGEFDVTLAQLLDAATKTQPAAWLAKIVRNTQAEREHEQAHEQAMRGIAISHDASEPEFVQEFRRAGYPIEKRDNGTWRIGGEIFNMKGDVIGF